ncbi:MAG: rcc01693 family protein [Marinibacterium sp.]
MSRLDWPAMMRAGMTGLGLRPAEFWALTPAELRLMLGQGATGAAPMGRAGLDALLAAYPDGRKGQDDDGSGRDRSAG